MKNNFDNFLLTHEDLVSEMTQTDSSRLFLIRIPELPSGRDIEKAWISIPKKFSDAELATIYLPKKYALKIPHVESSGRLCIDGDPGPQSGATPQERINQLINSFYSSFLDKWSRGLLDDHFEQEAMNYWRIHCNNNYHRHQAVEDVFLLNEFNNSLNKYTSTYLEERRIVIAGNDPSLLRRYESAMGHKSKISSISVTEIPISFPFTPHNWPRNMEDLEKIISTRYGHSECNKVLASHVGKNTSRYRIIIFRSSNFAFGYLLPGGPRFKIKRGYSINSYPNEGLTPLNVERLDISWTTGRDQHPEYMHRQEKHVLVIGAGALGSPVAEQLAKAGIGKLTLIDDDILKSANIGRHTLGADSINYYKVRRLADSISLRWPTCNAVGHENSIQKWLKNNSIKQIDVILDFTGEPEVRLHVDMARRSENVDLMIAWMEPYVVSAHACILPSGTFWVNGDTDRLAHFNVADWPDDVMVREPACSSSFQSYTSSAATHAVALATEAALDLVDKKIRHPIIRHWVRGKKFIDSCYPGLKLKDWALFALDFDGCIKEFDFE